MGVYRPPSSEGRQAVTASRPLRALAWVSQPNLRLVSQQNHSVPAVFHFAAYARAHGPLFKAPTDAWLDPSGSILRL